MKTKVLFIVSSLERSGPVNIIYGIVKYLDRSRFDAGVLSLSASSNSRKKDFEDLSVTVFELTKSRLYWMLSDMKEVREIVAQFSPAIIHSHSLRADIFSAKYLSAYRRISTVHGHLRVNYTDTYNAFIGAWFENRQINSISKMEMAAACAEHVRETYLSKLPDAVTVQNGIDDNDFLAASDKTTQRRKLNLPEEGIIFITTGLLVKRKDPETIIRGFLECSEASSATLLVLGAGRLEKSLKEKYGAYPSVRFLGFTSQVRDYLQASDFFLSGSSSEGLPNAVLEALSCGLGVCLSDIPPHREILSIDNSAGKLFEYGSASDLRRAMDSILSDDRDTVKVSAKNIIASRLNAKTMTEKYEVLYNELIEKQHE